MRAFVFPLLSAGYRVIAYDQPAHGVSEGRLTGLPDFAEVLADIAGQHGRVQAVIGHSLGGAAAALALARGTADFRKVVMVSPPSDLVGYSRRFARWHWIPEAMRRSMQSAIEERYGVRWEDLELSRLASRLNARALVIHDRNDHVVPWAQGENVARLWPNARLLTTTGLGHGRILQDEQVTRAAADFIARG
jgi:pimeloyl-ACP methyl ester carboxylesterase